MNHNEHTGTTRRTFHTVHTADGPQVEQYFAPLDCSGNGGPMLGCFELAALARQRAIGALCDGDAKRFNREILTYHSYLKRTLGYGY